MGRYDGTWTLAVTPDEPNTKMPEGNLLELTKHKWTLIHRDKNGRKGVVPDVSEYQPAKSQERKPNTRDNHHSTQELLRSMSETHVNTSGSERRVADYN